MSISVTKQGPYFTSGSISFSQLRSTFKETGSGSISASELRRNTDRNEKNPVVPDSTENENISTGSNLSLSQFRNSVKRYYATQSGRDDNSSLGSGEPGLRLGRYNSSTGGVDWSGGGNGGRDGQNYSDGNYTRNIQKFISITGICGSYYRTMAALQLAPGVPVYNTTITISGQIYGAGGEGGVSGDGNGKDGGPAVNIQYDQGGNVSPVIIESSARIWAGGGGGEVGANGVNGATGLCISQYSTNGCGSAPPCNSGDFNAGGISGACCDKPKNKPCRAFNVTQFCRREVPSSTPTGGTGGNGGKGRGYIYPSDVINLLGSSGTKGICPTCSSGSLNGGTCGTDGSRGGAGGDWASDGEETAATWHRGYAGKAFLGSYYILTGSLNGTTIRGAYNA